MHSKGKREEEEEYDSLDTFEEEPENVPIIVLEQVQDTCRECYSEKWRKYIRTCHQVEGRLMDICNVRLQNQGPGVEEMVRHVFRQQGNALKINVAFGFILKNEEMGEVRYYYPSQNGFVFDAPFFISNVTDLAAFLKKLKQEDWLEYLRQQKPNSKWSIAMFTNVALYVYKTNPLGQWEPSYLDG